MYQCTYLLLLTIFFLGFQHIPWKFFLKQRYCVPCHGYTKNQWVLMGKKNGHQRIAGVWPSRTIQSSSGLKQRLLVSLPLMQTFLSTHGSQNKRSLWVIKKLKNALSPNNVRDKVSVGWTKAMRKRFSRWFCFVLFSSLLNKINFGG